MAVTEQVDLSHLATALKALGRPVLNYDPLFRRFKVLLEAESKRSFDESRAPDGTPWQPLKNQRDRARDKKARGGTGQKPLRDTGTLMMSVTARQDGPFSMAWGSNLDYAGIHQRGGTIAFRERTRGKDEKPWVFKAPDGRTIFTRHIKAHSVTIPARPYIGFTPRTEGIVQTMAAEYTAQEVAKRAFKR